MKKQELRTLYNTRRTQLSQTEYERLNQCLLLQFQQLNLQGISCIHLFLPIHKRKEPDTFLIRTWLQKNRPDINLVFPKADFAANSMQNFLDDADLQLDINAFGIPEPLAGNTVEVAQIDMLLIPLLAFDTKGYRVGYGKGFYDRFIAQCRAETQLVGMSFFEPVDSIEDINEFDKPLQQCITPNKVYSFT